MIDVICCEIIWVSPIAKGGNCHHPCPSLLGVRLGVDVEEKEVMKVIEHKASGGSYRRQGRPLCLQKNLVEPALFILINLIKNQRPSASSEACPGEASRLTL